jgi:hypothetical protein
MRHLRLNKKTWHLLVTVVMFYAAQLQNPFYHLFKILQADTPLFS